MTDEGRSGSIEEAETEVQKYKDAEARLTAELERLQVRLAEEESEAGDRILEGVFLDDTKKMRRVTTDLTATRTEIFTIQRALEAAKAGVTRVEGNLMLSQAEELRRRASQWREEAASRQVRTSKLLEELEGHEGVTFAPALLPPSKTGVDWVPVVGIPRSQRLLMQAKDLEDQAHTLEEQATKGR